MMKIDIKSKSFTMLISIFFAVVFWAFVMADSNTVRVSEIRDVAINFSGTESITEKGMVITGKSKEQGNIRIEGGVNVVGYLTTNNVGAYVDLSHITEPGEYELTVHSYCNNNSVLVKSFSPSKIKVVVEKYVEKQVPVEIAYDKDISGEYWINQAKAQSDRMIVSGGQSAVQRVTKATVTVNTDALVQSYEENPLSIYEASIHAVYTDENGNEIKGLNDQAMIVSVDMMSKKAVKVDVQGAVAGNPAEGYKVISIGQNVSEIDIVGKKNIINKITSLSVESINIDGAAETVVVDAVIKKIDGITLIGNDTIKVNVNIEREN